MQPETRYAKSGDVHIAYQVFGEGPLNLVFVPPFFSNVEGWWDEPDYTRALVRLGSYAKVLIFDKRGTGLSDRVAELPGLEQRIDDLRAVMDAVGMEQAALIVISEGGSMAALFAATYPSRCRALVLIGAYARFSSFMPSEEASRRVLQIYRAWVGQRRQRAQVCAHARQRPDLPTLVGPARAVRSKPRRGGRTHAHEQSNRH